MENRAEMAGGVCVFAPSTIVTVTVETADDGDEVHFHGGGQGFWIARPLGRLGVQTSLVTPLGGEAGRVVRALIEAEAIELRAVETSTATGTWVHDRRSGERVTVAEHEAQALDRHATDELYGAALAAALNAGICVLAGPHRPDQMSGAMYRRLCGDLRANGVTVIADLSGSCLLGALESGVDFCKSSDEDLAKTDGFDPDDPPAAHLEQLVAAGAANAALTRGPAPTLASLDGSVVEVVAPRFAAVDHRGAGDAFTALVAACRFWGLDWSDAVRWGAAAGSLTVVRRGLATADRREIHQLLSKVHLAPVDDRWVRPASTDLPGATRARAGRPSRRSRRRLPRRWR